MSSSDCFNFLPKFLSAKDQASVNKRGIDIRLSVVEMHCSFGFKNFLTSHENAR